MNNIGKKIFEEIDFPTNSRIISENKDKSIIERESSWKGKIKGIGSFPNSTLDGHGHSVIFENGISISNWQGILTIENGQEISFVGKDTSKNDKYYVLRTYFTRNEKLQDLDGMVCFLEGFFDSKNKSYTCSGYRLI
jgi:hypothetical protein